MTGLEAGGEDPSLLWDEVFLSSLHYIRSAQPSAAQPPAFGNAERPKRRGMTELRRRGSRTRMHSSRAVGWRTSCPSPSRTLRDICRCVPLPQEDRKSTRLNSSHLGISYA